MLKNLISKILYYDYLGLDYRRKAGKILSKCGYVKEEFESESMCTIMEFVYSEDDMKHINCLIERADICFMKAQKLAKENILWEGYLYVVRMRKTDFNEYEKTSAGLWFEMKNKNQENIGIFILK